MAELEGKTLDRYDLRRIIGKGGMANVYEAYDPGFHRAVAVKVFKREDEDMLRRFIREANVMARLHHPHLVAIYDTGECLLDGVTRYYIVMPLLTGGTLRARIRRSPLSLAEICRCLSDIGGALDYIHAQGIVHRDIKASNVLLNEEGRCYLTDFGIARITGGDVTQLTGTGDVLGTVDYVAPELFEVHRRADARSDLYSLGVLLYEMVTGRLPFSADSQLALVSMHVSKRPPSPLLYVPQLSQKVVGVIYRALEKQPEMRYGSAGELAEAFCRAVRQGEAEVAALPAGAPGSRVRESVPGSASMLPQKQRTERAAPLADGTAAFPYAPPPLPPSASPLPETPLPVPAAGQIGARRGPPRSRRMLVLALLMISILFIVSAAAAYAVLRQTVTPTPTPTRITQGSVTAGVASPGVTGTPGSVTPNLTQTAQAAATATTQATATAIARATVTANARATATVEPLQTATSGTPDYQDPLTDPNNPATVDAGWDTNSQCFFADDGYHVTQPAGGTYFKGCREHNKTYANLALTVDVTILSGHSGGVFFRLKTNLIGNYDGYLFEIDSQGNAKISYEQGAGINTLQDWSTTPLLQRGYGVTNRLELIARGTTLNFYINGKFFTQIQDNYETAANTIGFLATASQGGSAAEVVYHNLRVYALP